MRIEVAVLLLCQCLRTDSAAATRVSVTSVVYSSACALGVDGCEVSYDICFLPSSTATACETALLLYETIADGNTTWTPSTSPRESAIEFGQVLPTTIDLGATITLGQPGAPNAASAYNSMSTTVDTRGTQTVTLTVADTGIQATVTLLVQTVCETGFYGTACITQCTPYSDSTNGFYFCDSDGNKICSDGYTGASCTEDIDECTTSPCQNNGVCSNTVGSYICTCMDGCSGTDCSTGTTTTVTRTLSRDVLKAITLCSGLSASITGTTTVTIKLVCGTDTTCLDNVNQDDYLDDGVIDDGGVDDGTGLLGVGESDSFGGVGDVLDNVCDAD